MMMMIIIMIRGQSIHSFIHSFIIIIIIWWIREARHHFILLTQCLGFGHMEKYLLEFLSFFSLKNFAKKNWFFIRYFHSGKGVPNRILICQFSILQFIDCLRKKNNHSSCCCCQHSFQSMCINKKWKLLQQQRIYKKKLTVLPTTHHHGCWNNIRRSKSRQQQQKKLYK